MGKVEQILAAMSIAGAPEELDIPGFDFHELKHDRKGTYSVAVSGNYRVTFMWNQTVPTR